jgi:hypothetical protein
MGQISRHHHQGDPVIYEYIFEQVLEEGPQIMDLNERRTYVENIVNSWTNTEMLQRINDALVMREDS